MFPIWRVASKDNRADDAFFERRKPAYQAFVENKRGGAAGSAGKLGATSQVSFTCPPPEAINLAV